MTSLPKAMQFRPLIFLLPFLLFSCEKEEALIVGDFSIDSIFVNGVLAPNNSTIYGVDFQQIEFKAVFSKMIDTSAFWKRHFYISGGVDTTFLYRFGKNNRHLFINPQTPLQPLNGYRVSMGQGPMLGGNASNKYSFVFQTDFDSSFKFPPITDDELLTLVQQQTFKYFWDYAHPTSGLARERLGSGDLVTIGGSGFGLLAILVGIERGFITRQQGFERLNTIVDFLINPHTDRFHGAFPHWLNGSTGKTIPFSTHDNGADLVETAFLIQGLLAVREYFGQGSLLEKAMCNSIQQLWEEVEWTWFCKNGGNVLFWHWSPEYEWSMNLPIRGWNEALIVYILAASSPTYPITKEVYQEGWANYGSFPMVNGKTFYGETLPLGVDYGGPLFFAHFSFLGLDPRNLSDSYANYWEQNVAHSLINRAYCIANPKNFMGYSDDCWGLTASDIQNGYAASSPTHDLGTIAPTAAISSLPYTPQESLRALRFFYYVLGDKTWGEYGFYDAFSISKLWFAQSYLAIDQGPIVCMIENYRTGFLWNLFMSAPEVQQGLNRLGFLWALNSHGLGTSLNENNPTRR